MKQDDDMRERLRQLIDAGVNEKDAAVTVNLGWAIRSLDFLLFPGNQAQVNLVVALAHDYRIAEYNSVNDQYSVYSSHARDQFVKTCLLTPLESEYLDGRQPPHPTMMEAIVGVSVHEVRHRLQFKQKDTLRLWDYRHRADDLMNRILHRVHRQDSTVSAREFDAQVIEMLALHRLPALESPRALGQIVLQ